MNLEDVIDPKFGLLTDKWSNLGLRFGKDNQVKVIGWSGLSGGKKYYVVKCDICARDPELFGEGYFKIRNTHLKDGVLPCSCSPLFKPSLENYKILCKRICEKKGYEFVGLSGKFRGNLTPVISKCSLHGSWTICSIAHTLSRNFRCPLCPRLSEEDYKQLDEHLIKTFFDSGKFHPETKFWRSERVDKNLCRVFWFMDCPDCGSIGESHRATLQRGQKSCECSVQRQRTSYINLLVNKDDKSQKFIKFGISNNIKARLKTQRYHSRYEVINYACYSFNTVEKCKSAERECKMIFKCSVLSKEEFSDGYTETTSVDNLKLIEDLFIKYGGIKKDSNDDLYF